jgi:hypothetical protein
VCLALQKHDGEEQHIVRLYPPSLRSVQRQRRVRAGCWAELGSVPGWLGSATKNRSASRYTVPSGQTIVCSHRPPSRQTRCTLNCPFAELEKELALGPAVHGWEDQRWTLARIRALIAWKFSLDCSSAAVWRLLHRHGWSWQCPARRALERDEAAVGLWKKDVWPLAE